MDRISVHASDVLLAGLKRRRSGNVGCPGRLVLSSAGVWILGCALAILFGAASPVAAQLGVPNPNQQVFVTRPVPGGPFTVVPPGTPGSRETIPFSDEPHRLNNAHPVLPNAGLGYALRQVWVAPQPVALLMYVPALAQYQTRQAEIPGFYVMETTTGYLYPERWTIYQLNVGVYRWGKTPAQFVPR